MFMSSYFERILALFLSIPLGLSINIEIHIRVCKSQEIIYISARTSLFILASTREITDECAIQKHEKPCTHTLHKTPQDFPLRNIIEDLVIGR